MKARPCLAPLAALLLALLILSPVRAATIHVPADQPTIAAGLDAAAEGDTVLIACGTYYEHGLTLTSGLTVRSETGDPDCVTIDGQSQDRVMVCEYQDLEIVLEGITFTHGYADRGAGIEVKSSPVTVRHCRFAENDAYFTAPGALRFLSCSGDEQPVIESCLFESNGNGAILFASGGGEVRDCTFLDHVGPRPVLWFYSNKPGLVSGCVFARNLLDDWPVVKCNSDADVSIDSCTFVGNRSSGSIGGIIYGYGCAPILTGCVFAFNDTPEVINMDYNGRVDLYWCNIYGNTGGDWAHVYEDQLGVDENISADPLFCDIAGRDYSLCSNSPCLPANGIVSHLIGALDAGCGDCQSPVQSMSWGAIKALYR